MQQNGVSVLAVHLLAEMYLNLLDISVLDFLRSTNPDDILVVRRVDDLLLLSLGEGPLSRT